VDYEAGGLIAAGMDGTNPRVLVPLPANRQRGIAGEISVSPDGKQIAFNLGTPEGNSFCVVGVDGSGFREVYRKPLRGLQPVGGWSPDGLHFLGHILEPDGSHTVASISVLDGSLQKIHTDREIQTEWALATGGGGTFSPDGKYVVFGVRKGTSQQSDIHVLAVDGSYQGKLVEHPSMNRALDFTSDGKHFLFQSDRSGKAAIYALAVSNGRAQGEPVLIKQEAGMFEGSVSLTRNGTLFYAVGEQSRHEAFTLSLDPVSGTVTGSPQLLSGPSGMTPESAAWSPDGKRLAFVSGSNHEHGGGGVTLTVRTLASGQEVEWKMPSEVEAIVGWAADGNGIYTAIRHGTRGEDLRMELHSVSPSTGETRQLAVIRGARVIYSVRPAPDGNALLISYGDQPPQPGRPAGVIRRDLLTGQQTELIPKGVVSEASISPDGKQVAALDRQANSASILVKPLEGGEWKTLATLQGAGYMYLHWLPGGVLMFGKEGFPNSALFRLPSTGGAPQKVGDLVSLDHVHEIRVHPDGRQMIFQSYVTHTELWALENFLPKDLMER